MSGRRQCRTRGWWRAFGAARATFGIVVTFVAATVLGFLLHLNLPSARRLAVAQIDALLRPVFKGTIEVDGLERLRLNGVDGMTVRIVDGDGVNVITAQGVRARISLWAVLRSTLFGKAEIDIALSEVSIDHSEVNLDLAADGTPRIAHAFDLRTPTPSSSPNEASRAVRVALPEIMLKHSWVHGPVAGAPPLDVETLALHGSVFVRNKGVTIDVTHVAVSARGMPTGANPHGDAEVHLALPSKTGQDIGLEVTFAGAVGTLPMSAHGTMDGPVVDATLDVPKVAAEALRAMIPSAPIYEAVGVHAVAHGSLPALESTAHFTIGTGTVDVRGQVEVAGTLSGGAHVRAERIDLRAFSPTLPSSELDAKVDLTFSAPPGRPITGELAVNVTRGDIEHHVVPPASLSGDFTWDANARNVVPIVRAHGTISEEGAPLNVSADLRPDGTSGTVTFALNTSVPDLSAIARVHGLPQGRALLAANGSLRLANTSLDVTAEGTVAGLQEKSLSIESATFTAHAFGPLRNLSVQSALHAVGARAGTLEYASVDANSSGPLILQKVDFAAKGVNAPDLEAHATLDAQGPLTVRDTELVARHAGVELDLHADTLESSDNVVRIDGVRVRGLGDSIWAHLELTPSAITVRAGTRGVDLSRLARLLRLDDAVDSGELTFDVDFDARKDGASGKFAIDLTHGSFGAVKEINAHVSATMSGRRITGEGHAAVADIGSVDIKKSRIEVGGGGALKLSSWRKAWGELAIGGSIDLAKLAAVVPKNVFPFGEMGGVVYFEGRSARESLSDLTPALSVSARTNGLVLSGKAPAAWRSSGVDVQLDTTVDGETGFGELALRMTDTKGLLAALDAKSSAIPFAEIYESTGALAEDLESAPFAATLVIPRRRISTWPKTIPMPDLHGELDATAAMTGSVRAPVLDVTANGYALADGDAPKSVAMGAKLTAHYDGHDATAKLELRSPKEAVFDGDGHAAISTDALLDGQGGSWAVSAAAKLTRFPLAAFPALEDRGIRGHVTGQASLVDLHKDARAALTLAVENLQIGAEKYSGGSVDVKVDDHALAASAHLAQANATVEASAKVGVAWGARIAPAFDDSEPIALSFRAKHFSAAAILPLTGDTFTELDGTLDGNASVDIDAKANSAKMQGSIVFDNGTLQLSASGQEFHKTHAKLTLTPDGLIRLDDVVAYGLSGKLTASGVARMNGLRLGEARLNVRIPKNQPIPLDVQGAEVGAIDGDFSLVATSPRPKLVSLNVVIPTMHVQLPLSSTHDVESLDPPAHVQIGVYRANVPVPLALTEPKASEDTESTGTPTELEVAVHLGQDVEIRRGTDLKVTLDGSPLIKVANRTTVSGQIRLKSGTLDVQGKRFEIESGTVSFVGTDPTNPEVVVTASWSAPDGTRVYADFTGPLKTGKVTLRSEPSLTVNEIRELILFGTADGASSTPTSGSTQSTTAMAGAAASGLATEGLNHGLDRLTGLDVTTRVDTTDAANPRPEVEVQIARDISLQVAFVIGTPPPGQNPDTTYATIDWRFIRNWSLATTFGDKGSSIADLVWQFRY